MLRLSPDGGPPPVSLLACLTSPTSFFDLAFSPPQSFQLAYWCFQPTCQAVEVCLNSLPCLSLLSENCVVRQLISTTSTCFSITPRKRFILLCFHESNLFQIISFKKRTVVVKQPWTCIKCISSMVRSNIIDQICWPQIFFGVFLLKCTCQFNNNWAVKTEDGCVSEI